MIRLIVAAVVCLALHPAATGQAHARERTIAAVAGGDHVAAPSSLDAGGDGAALASEVAIAPRVWLAAARVAADSWVAVARLWLRGQRLLC